MVPAATPAAPLAVDQATIGLSKLMPLPALLCCPPQALSLLRQASPLGSGDLVPIALGGSWM